MRISGLVIFVLLVVTGGFVYLGYSTPEFSFRTQVVVKAPIDVVFAGFTDQSRMPDWVANLTSIQPLRGELNEVGSYYRATFTEEGRDIIETRQIVAFVDNQRVGFDTEQNNMTTSVDVLFEQMTAGTSIAAYHTVRPKGLFWQALLRLRKSRMLERHGDDYQRLKAMLENAGG